MSRRRLSNFSEESKSSYKRVKYNDWMNAEYTDDDKHPLKKNSFDISEDETDYAKVFDKS
jgi:hypothetical protein